MLSAFRDNPTINLSGIKCNLLAFIGVFLVVVIGLSISFLFSAEPTLAQASWYDSNWDYRVKVTVDNTQVSEDLQNFPVYIDLADIGSDFFSNVQTDGGDIRVTQDDGVTEIPREVVSVDTASSTGELHFKAPTISSSSDTIFYIYYGNASATDYAPTDANGRNAVWSNGFEAVYHLNEDPSSSAPQYKDATGNGNDASVSGAITRVDEKLGEGMYIDTDGEYIDTGGINIPANSDFTYSQWLEVNDGLSGNRGLWRAGPDSQGGNFNIFDNARPWVRWSGNNILHPGSGASFPSDQLSYMVYRVRSDADVSWFVDGVEEHSNTHSAATADFSIHNIGYQFSSGNFLTGTYGEMRFATTDRSDAWLSSAYTNQNSTLNFYAVSDQSINEGGISLTTSTSTNITSDSVTVNGNISDTSGEIVDERGFVYATSSNSYPGDTAPGSTSYTSVVSESGSFSTGAFSENITNLSSDTTYYVRAYAHSVDGYSYGTEKSFATEAVPVITDLSHTPTLPYVGEDITFSVDFSHPQGDAVKTYICMTDAFTAGSGCNGGSWAASSTAFSTSSPQEMTYTATESDVGENSYYAFVEDEDGEVSSSTFGTFDVGDPDASPGWYDDSWGEREKITINHMEVPEDLENFPVYIDLADLSDTFFETVQENGADIRVTAFNGTTEIPREVVDVNTASSTGELHFKAPRISSSQNTDFYVYYDNPSADGYAVSDFYGRNAVWSNGFAAVLHMTTSNIIDSTGNGNNGTSSNTTEAVGNIGSARYFDGSSSITVEDDSTLDIAADYHETAWINPDSIKEGMNTIVQKDLGTWALVMQMDDGEFYAGFEDASDDNYLGRAGSIQADKWQQITVNHESPNISLYVDNEKVYSMDTRGAIPVTNDSPLKFGEGNGVYEGIIEEFRLASTARSSSWIESSHTNQDTPLRFYFLEDSTPPQIEALTPADNATDAPVNNLTISFDEPVIAATSTNGLISIYNDDTDTLVQSIDPESGQVSGLGSRDLTLTLNQSLEDLTSYHVEISPLALTDYPGHAFAGFADDTTWNFTTGDNTVDDPADVSFIPSDDSQSVSLATDLSLIFSEPMEILPGAEVILHDNTGVNQNIKIPTDSGELTGGGTEVISIVPDNDLEEETDYAITVASSSFADLSGNEFAGFSDESIWNFTTQDITPPALSSTYPADNSTSVSAADLQPELTFDETISLENGDITIFKADGSTHEVFSVSGQQVTGDGTDTVTLFPLNDFSYDTSYYVQIDNSAIADTAGNFYEGISATTTFNFTTAIPSAAEAAANGDIIIDFDQEVKKGTGNVTIYNADSGAVFEAIDVTTDQVIMSGGATTSDQAIVSPTNDLESEQNYYVIADDGAFLLPDGTPIPENDEDEYRVTGPDETAPTVTSLSPSDDAGGVSPSTDLRVYFSEPVYQQSGLITVFDDTDNTVIADISINDTDKVSGADGTNSVTIDLADNLPFEHDIHVEFESGVLADEAGNDFTGLDSSTDWNFTVAAEGSGDGGGGGGGDGSDENTAPSIESAYPANGRDDVATSTSALTVVYSEPVVLGSGNLQLKQASDGSVVADFPTSSEDISLTPETTILTASLSDLFVASTTYYVQIDEGFVVDTEGANSPALTATTSWRFTTVSTSSDSGDDGGSTTTDTTAPRISQKSPSDNNEEVATSTGLSILFREPVERGVGSLKIFSSADDQLVEEIDIDTNADQVSGENESRGLGFSLTNPLAYNTRYYVTLDSGLVADLSGNAFAGLSDSTLWNFKTVSEESGQSSDPEPDTTAPDYELLIPQDDEDVSANTGLSIVFSEDVSRQSGSIRLYRGDNDQLVEEISVTDDQADFFPLQRQLSFELTDSLATSTDYYVQLDAGVVVDEAGNEFSGISASSSWNFRTRAEEQTPSPGPVVPGDEDDDGFIDYLTLAFTEPIDPGSGTVSVYRTSDNARLEQIDISSPRVTGFGTNLVTIELAQPLSDTEDYYVNISPGAFVASDDGEDVPEVDGPGEIDIPGTGEEEDLEDVGPFGRALLPRGEIEDPAPVEQREIDNSPECSRLIIDYLEADQNNDYLEVLKLQAFLNLHTDLTTPVSGEFGMNTESAVRKFQVNHAAEVLRPWGYGSSEPTGYVYITTRKKINELYCGRELDLPKDAREEINEFRQNKGLDPIIDVNNIEAASSSGSEAARPTASPVETSPREEEQAERRQRSADEINEAVGTSTEQSDDPALELDEANSLPDLEPRRPVTDFLRPEDILTPTR